MLILHSFHDRTVNIPPELDNVRIGLPPSIHQRREFLFGEAHLDSAHRLECTGGTTVAKGQFSDFAFLPEVAIDAMLLDRNLEHLRRTRAVDVAAIGKDLLSPALISKPRDDTGLDGRKVRHQELCALTRDERGADELGQGIRHIFI